MTLLITMSLSGLNGLCYYPICTDEYFHWDGSYKAALDFMKERQVNPLEIDCESMQDDFSSYVFEQIKKDGRIIIRGKDTDGFDIQIKNMISFTYNK